MIFTHIMNSGSIYEELFNNMNHKSYGIWSNIRAWNHHKSDNKVDKESKIFRNSLRYDDKIQKTSKGI